MFLFLTPTQWGIAGSIAACIAALAVVVAGARVIVRRLARTLAPVKLIPVWSARIRFSGGVSGTVDQVPIADFELHNKSRRAVRDVTILIDTSPLDPHMDMPVFAKDASAHTGVPIVPAEYVTHGQSIQVRALEFPWKIQIATARISWRTWLGRRSKPLISRSPDYGIPVDPNDFNVLDSAY